MTTTLLSPDWPQGVPGAALANGVIFALSMIRAGDVTDGLTSTYLLGEKNLNPDSYYNGGDGADAGFALGGFNYDICRFAEDYSNCHDSNGTPCTPWDDQSGPYPDRPGDATHQFNFGSAHAVGFNMALCDGSVRMVGYTIDQMTHSHLCNRRDGQVIDFKKAF